MLESPTHYYSESKGEMVRIKDMPVPYAENALNRLRRELGPFVDSTPTGAALLTRSLQDGVATDVLSLDGKSKMIRDPETGKFVGTWK